MFYEPLGVRESQGISFAVMDTWKLFRNAAYYVPQAAVLVDKFRIMRHLALNIAQGWVRPPSASRPPLHQGPEAHAALAP